jgi:outer membrane lipoprotein-sorting protein
MPTTRCFVIVGVLSLLGSVAAAEPPDPTEIMRRVESRDRGDRMSARMKMTISRGGREQTRSLAVRSMRSSDGRRTMMRLEAPAEVRGTGLLSYEYDGDRGQDQWLYLPSLGRPTRVSSADRAGGFMGSDFSYSDMAAQKAADYDYALVAASVRVAGEDCWLIEARPATDRVRRETGYLKVHFWISKEKLMPLQIKAWVAEGRRLKYFGFGSIERIDGVWVARRAAARTVQHGQVSSTTTLELTSVAFEDRAVSEADFTPGRLQRVP